MRKVKTFEEAQRIAQEFAKRDGAKMLDKLIKGAQVDEIIDNIAYSKFPVYMCYVPVGVEEKHFQKREEFKKKISKRYGKTHWDILKEVFSEVEFEDENLAFVAYMTYYNNLLELRGTQ